MLRNVFRIILGVLMTAALLGLYPSTSQSASADQLNVVPLQASSAAVGTASLARSSDGLISFVRGVRLPAGPGHRSGPVRLGIWNAKGIGHGFQIEFTSHHGVPGNGNVPGMNQEDSRCTKDISARYKNASRATAAASAIVILNRQHQSPWPRYYRWASHHHKVSNSLKKRVRQINSACKHHSPFRASMQTESVYYGEVGSGITSVLADNGLTAPSGLDVRTVGTGSRIISADHHTNSRGKAGFRFRLTGFDAGSAESTVTGPDATRGDLVVTPDGKTRLLVNSYKTSAKANGKLRQKNIRRPTVTTSCGYACNGRGSVKVKAKVPARAGSPVRFTAHNDGKNHNWYVRPGHKKTAKFNADDASQVSLSYCYVNHVNKPCASKTHTYTRKTEVVAPAWINLDDTGHCCSSKGSSVKLSMSLRSDAKRFYRVWVIVNKHTVQTLDLSSSAPSAAQSVTIKRGRVQVRFTAYRNSDHSGNLSTQTVYDRTFN
jgi:hypothetical protein